MGVHLLTCKEVEDENDDENENDWGSGGGEPSIAGIVCLKAIDQSGQHCYNTREHLLTGFNTIGGDEALSDRRIEAGGALECRATGVIEKLGPLLTLTLAVSFGRVQKHRETCTVKLFDQLPSMAGRLMRGIIQKRCKPGDESEFNAIDIEFFVIKKGIHSKNKTNY